jgi:glucose-6-phosphate isomerase
VVPVDFIAVIDDDSGLAGHNDALLANCFAQSQALAFGKTLAEAQAEAGAAHLGLAPHRSFPGDRPSSTLLMDALTPATLGALLALYEHKVFVQSVSWNVNAFDQWHPAAADSRRRRLADGPRRVDGRARCARAPTSRRRRLGRAHGSRAAR